MNGFATIPVPGVTRPLVRLGSGSAVRGGTNSRAGVLATESAGWAQDESNSADSTPSGARIMRVRRMLAITSDLAGPTQVVARALWKHPSTALARPRHSRPRAGALWQA